MIESAGTLLYRRNGERLEVLIVHPWGPYNRRAPWSIPKGRTNPGEDIEAAARRETVEETGVKAGPLHSIGSVDLARSRKRIHGFAGPAPEDAAPRSDQKEVDEAKFVPIDRARFLLHPAQVTFLDRLLATIDLEAAVSDPRSARRNSRNGGGGEAPHLKKAEQQQQAHSSSLSSPIHRSTRRRVVPASPVSPGTRLA